MAFNSLTFIVFFLVVLGLYYALPTWRSKKQLMLGASYLFYAAWNPPFIVLLWLSTVVDWFAVKGMAKAESQAKKRLFLIVSLCTNLGLLSIFKYGEFFLHNTQYVLSLVGIYYVPPEMSIILPMGISFYTFQTMSYSIDVYRGVGKPWGSFLDFALFVTFFPQLVAGPIVRAVDFLPQCLEPRRATAKQFGWGLVLVALGMFQKNIIADNLLAPVADEIYNNPDTATFLSSWVGTIAFSGQIFCDFAGYSSCGIGIALCMGFVLPDNFRAPYSAIGFSDFWRRWHISLSSWLRDYLYIPMGGNRSGQGRRMTNLMMTMLIGGLWHGAAWRFVVWGGLHGSYLAVEAGLKKRFGDWPVFQTWLLRVMLCLLTYAAVCVAWVFFRAQDFTTAFTLITAMFTGGTADYHMPTRAMVAVLAVAGLLVAHWRMQKKSLEETLGRLPTPVLVGALSIMVLALILIHGENRAFIYFQF